MTIKNVSKDTIAEDLSQVGTEGIPRTNGEALTIITVTIQCMQCYAPKEKARYELLKQVVEESYTADIILFPAGYFSHWRFSVNYMRFTARKVQRILCKAGSMTTICFGIDYADSKDQLAIAVDQSGIIAIGRKFHPTKDEVCFIRTATGFNENEQGYSRIFHKNGKRLYMAVCYDGFGIRNLNIPNPNIDIVLILAHQFNKPGEGLSGAVDFARKGFAGASTHWKCPVFGTAVFYRWIVPEKWPTGILWDSNGESVRTFKYSDNKLKWDSKYVVEGSFETAICYQYHIYLKSY